jgi:N-acetylglucosamine malate deacetylase 1
MKKENIVIFGAHSDDFVIGAGGTIAKYAQEGKNIISIIFSYGEKSHPWLKENVVQKFRAKETLEAGKILNCQNIFLDLKELNFLEQYDHNYEKKLLAILNKFKPVKIFTHSGEDPHPDHQAVNKITLELYDKIKFKPEVYIYSVWNPVSFKTKYPVLYEDITKTFTKQLEALKSFRSQKIHIFFPTFLLLFRAFKNGLKIRKWVAEKFFRTR